MSGAGENQMPTHELIYRQLREQVLFGDLAPGQAVTIQGLTDSLGAGMTPVREAIRRLIAEGALEFQGNRRVCVPLLSADNISELIVARQWLDPHLALRATERVTLDELDELTAMDADLDVAIGQGDLRAYLETELPVSQASLRDRGGAHSGGFGGWVVAAVRAIPQGCLRPDGHAEPARQTQGHAGGDACPRCGTQPHGPFARM